MNADTQVMLPAPFASLQGFVRQWAQPTLAERSVARDMASLAELQAFYATATGLIEPVLDSLDATTLAEFCEVRTTLLHLVLAYAHVCQAVEVQQDVEPFHRTLRKDMPITHAPGDAWG